MLSTPAKKMGCKIVSTSIQGTEENTAFSSVVQSNRQAKNDIKNSKLNWVISRNGIYIETDIEYMENYKKVGKIANCTNYGLCEYTIRTELGFAYAKMLTEDKHNGQFYNLHGKAITQSQLADYLNLAFNTDLKFEPMSVENYKKERIAELGEFIGTVIAGIYQGICEGKFNNSSDFEKASGRKHQS